tara:strand:+ start:602 stop:1678 length:1077 start_codon:yes stop_codon:yes gene_type:complete
MNLFKKTFFNYLYIFFFILVFILFKFSTNFVLASEYNITKINIDETYDLNFDKSKVIDKAFKIAFKNLIYKILQKKDYNKFNNIKLTEIKSLVNSFTITNEKFINNNYMSEFNVQFNKKRILKFIEEKNVISSLPKNINVFILPIIIETKKKQISYLNENIFLKKWNNTNKNYFLLKYILPNEDIEDYSIMQKNIYNIENYDFEEIIKKYNVNNHIILLIFKYENELKILSKLNFNGKNMIVNKSYKYNNTNINEKTEKIILELKEIYEDKWKSINKLNTSIALPIKLSVSSKNVEQIKKLENALLDIDLISDFAVDRFDNNKTIYKIIFNSTPDKFLESMEFLDFKIDTSRKLWEIK